MVGVKGCCKTLIPNNKQHNQRKLQFAKRKVAKRLNNKKRRNNNTVKSKPVRMRLGQLRLSNAISTVPDLRGSGSQVSPVKIELDIPVAWAFDPAAVMTSTQWSISPQFLNNARLNTLSNIFTECRLRALSARFIPMYGTGVPGNLACAFTYDYFDTAAPSYINILTMSGSVGGPVYKPCVIRWHPQPGDEEWGLTESTTTFRSDNRQYGLCSSVTLPSAAQNSSYYTIVFHLSIEYRKLRPTPESASTTTDHMMNDVLVVGSSSK